MKKRFIFMMLLTLAGACSAAPSVKVTVTNPIDIVRDSETISVDWSKIQQAIGDLKPADVVVVDLQTKQPLRTQVIEGEQAVLLFQTDLGPGEKKQFSVMKRPEDMHIITPEYRTYCRFIPERKDDFGWENDKVAFRMYGPALEYETITSGIDAWGKCVTYPIIDKFIKAYVEYEIPYHYDHGEGGDFYKVGNTLGCGGMAPFVDGKVRLPRNFTEWKILANGPIRSVFELSYKPWEAGPYTVSENKRISIDLGSNLSRVECTYTCRDAETLPLAAGIILRETSDQTWKSDNIIAYWLPTDFVEGKMGVGVVFGPDYDPQTVNADNHLLLTLDQKAGSPVVYYAGSCWDKNREFDTFDEWQQYLTDFKKRLENPVVIEMQN